MDIRKIKKLIELLEESGLAEIEITEGEESVRIARNTQSAPVVTQYAAAPAPGAPVAAAPAPAAAPAATVAAPTPAARDENLVTAPMVGTFYASPAPGAKSFVEVGLEVRVGQMLCIIEAMKMMNQIESERAAKVVAVLANNGEPAEFGQPVFAIEDAACWIRSSSPTAARSRCASCAPAASSASRRSPSIRQPTRTSSTSCWPTRRSASGRPIRAKAT